jgi:hypothetical protein
MLSFIQTCSAVIELLNTDGQADRCGEANARIFCNYSSWKWQNENKNEANT